MMARFYACTSAVCVAEPFASDVAGSGVEETLLPVEEEAADEVCATVGEANP